MSPNVVAIIHRNRLDLEKKVVKNLIDIRNEQHIIKEEIEVRVKQAIRHFFEYEKESLQQVISHIFLVLVKSIEENGTITITIVSNRPGLVIGAKGSTIDALKSSIKRQLDIKFLQIELSEFVPLEQSNEQLFKHFKK
jgi:ribosomal protein S3